jgi:hypothetical protein
MILQGYLPYQTLAHPLDLIQDGILIQYHHLVFHFVVEL